MSLACFCEVPFIMDVIQLAFYLTNVKIMYTEGSVR